MSRANGLEQHWITRQFRVWRNRRFGSLAKQEAHVGIKAVVASSYERADRSINLERCDELLAHYGLKLAVVPVTMRDIPFALSIEPLQQPEENPNPANDL